MRQNNSSFQTISTDVLVIGAGGAGLRAAIEVKKQGRDVLLLGKEVLGCAHTGMAMGGMNAAMKAPATGAYHAQITKEGGYHIGNERLAEVFGIEMPDRIHDLERYGVLFDRLENGEFYTWAGPKQEYPLNVCVGDYTGRAMMQGLVDELRRLNIRYIDECFVSTLLKKEKQVVGAMGIDIKTGSFLVFSAGAVLLASGGAGRMYKVTTNAASNTGDGYAMALQAGATLIDMEMVQFHPTGMADPPSSRGVLVTEKVRAHGGILRNKDGDRFMHKYYPKEMEVAKRDEVSKSIYQEVVAGNGVEGKEAVYLHVDHWNEKDIRELIPNVHEQYRLVGVDIAKHPMKVYPSMHHMMGGVKIDEWGYSSVPGLFAAGEVGGGVHGANRLGGNSIAEGQVFGRRAAISAATYAQNKDKESLPSDTIHAEMQRITSFLTRTDGVSPVEVEQKLKQTMWDYVGIFRDEIRMLHAQQIVDDLAQQAHHMKTRTSVLERNRDLQDCLEIQNMILTAQAVITAALQRTESRGAHSRTDYPDIDPAWEKNIAMRYEDGSFQLEVHEVEG